MYPPGLLRPVAPCHTRALELRRRGSPALALALELLQVRNAEGRIVAEREKGENVSLKEFVECLVRLAHAQVCPTHSIA